MSNNIDEPPATPPPARDTINRITIPNSKTHFKNNFEEVALFNNQLPNNSDSVRQPLSNLLTRTGRLNLYRAGSIARNNISKLHDGYISFYGTSRRALIKYDKNLSNKSNKSNKSKKSKKLEKLKKTYYRMVLSTTDTSKIVDLHLPIKINKIVEFLLSDSTTKDEINILLSTLFVNYKSLEELLAKYRSNKVELVRHSKDVKEDIKMAKILMKIFPYSIGTYTRAGLGHSHNEIIIWNKAINEKLQQVNNNSINSANTNTNAKTKKRKATRSGNQGGIKTKARINSSGNSFNKRLEKKFISRLPPIKLNYD